MEYSKPLNLLPQSYRDKYTNRYLMFGIGTVVLVLVLILGVTYINLAVTKLSINRLSKENTQYQSKQQKITALTDTAEKNKTVLNDFQKDNFPFTFFLQTVENQKPPGLTIISIDSADRLAKAMTAEQQPEPDAKPRQTAQPTQTPQPQGQIREIQYENDMSGNKLVVRGYSADPAEVAAFIDALSKLPYVETAELKAIEEHPVNEYQKANVFELILSLK